MRRVKRKNVRREKTYLFFCFFREPKEAFSRGVTWDETKDATAPVFREI
jgi:hypothetical protein